MYTLQEWILDFPGISRSHGVTVFECRYGETVKVACRMAPRVPGRGMILLLVAAADISTQCGGAGASGSVACGFAVSSRHLGLRGGEPAQDRLQKWRKKFPLGMQLYEAAGGVIPGPGDKWLPHADLLHIQALLKRGAKANFQGPGKYTPLHFAAAAGFVDVVELLLDHGADINATSKWLWTPLHLAAAQGHTGEEEGVDQQEHPLCHIDLSELLFVRTQRS